MESIIIQRIPHGYASHPCLTKLADGQWVVAFSLSMQRQRPRIHPPNDPGFVNMLTRSADQGRTWDEPRVAPGYDWHGVETPGLAQISNGDVLLNQWRFRWYPAETARKLWRAGTAGLYVIDAHTGRWRPAQTEADWDAHTWAYARADEGAYLHISHDGGCTWDQTVCLDIAPYQGAFSPRGVIELPSGTLLLALGSHEHDPLAASFVLRSTDGGQSWSRPVEAARLPGCVFSEPCAVFTSGGRVLLFSREEETGFIYQSDSADGGATWSIARPLPLWGYPTHAIQLADGRLLMVFGRRRTPMGIRAALSADDGRTWSPEFVVCDDLAGGPGGYNLGYPTVIEYRPGQLFTAYYAEDASGTTCIQGSYFSLQ